VPAPANPAAPLPSIKNLIEQCPRFRVPVVETPSDLHEPLHSSCSRHIATAIALPLGLSYVELQNAKDIKSICLEVDGQKYDLTRNQDTLSEAFHPPLSVSFRLCIDSACQVHNQPTIGLWVQRSPSL
ncbi:hypothetical protein EDD16DRAFT_1866614, partial [Pisolithus croceorrhizus]